MNRLAPSILLALVIAAVPAGAQADKPGVTATGTIGLTHGEPVGQPRPPWAPLRPFLGSTSYRGVLHTMLGSSHPHERSRAAFVLGLIGSRDSTDAIVPLLKDSERKVRVSAGLALGFLGDERGIHVCDAVLQADPDWIRYYAVYALWMMNSPRARAVLDRNRDGRGAFIGGVLRQALRVRYNKSFSPQRSSPTDAAKLDDLWAVLCDAFILEADHWWHKGDYDQTIRCHEAAVFVDPTYTEGYSLIAWLQWSMGDDAAAIRTLNRGIQAVPDSPDTWAALGEHYWLTKRYELALQPLHKSIELGGDHLVRRKYAYSLEQVGRPAESLAQWEAIEKECPTDPAAPLNVERLRKKLYEPSGK